MKPGEIRCSDSRPSWRARPRLCLCLHARQHQCCPYSCQQCPSASPPRAARHGPSCPRTPRLTLAQVALSVAHASVWRRARRRASRPLGGVLAPLLSPQ
eukprot:scaffold287206_cov37-Tisochrysis_lutea.AAC.2